MAYQSVIHLIGLRLFFPVCLLTACIVRPSLFSAFYGLIALTALFVPAPTSNGVPGTTRGFLCVAVLLSVVFGLCQLAFHVYLLAVPSASREFNKTCNGTAETFALFGVQSVTEASAWSAARLLAPEPIAIVACMVAIAISVLCRIPQTTLPSLLSTDVASVAASNGDARPSTPQPKSVYQTANVVKTAQRFSEIIWILMVWGAGAVYPSLASAPYYLMFLAICTYWATYKRWHRLRVKPLKILTAVYTFLHLLFLYICQLPLVQRSVDMRTLVPRLFGMSPIAEAPCNDPTHIHFLAVGKLLWPLFASPIVLFTLFAYTCLQLSWLGQDILTSRSAQSPRGDNTDGLQQELLQDSADEGPSGDASARRFTRGLSMIGEPGDNIFATAAAFVLHHSYALALITMMAWAITYHSWITLVFLLAACFLWMVNTRSATLRFSPAVVVYAEILLIAQYIFSMELTDKELPTTELIMQIGFSHPTGVKCAPVFLKTLYAIPFFLAMRMFLRDRHYAAHGRPTSPSRYGTFSESHGAPSLSLSETNLRFFSGALVKYWIYVCVLVILLVSIQQPVVAYSIIYMVCFALLIVMVQLSWSFTRKLLLAYWTLVTVFSIVVLLSVYIYQFHGVPVWFKNVTNLDDAVIKSLGLLQYSPQTLAWKLVTPISFLIVVVLQFKFFHKPFMQLTEIKAKPRVYDDSAHMPRVEVEAPPSLVNKLINCARRIYRLSARTLWRLAELHWAKLVVFSMIMLAVLEPCAVHLPLVFLAALMLLLRPLHTMLSVLVAIYVAAIAVTKLLFQMSFVPENLQPRNCYNDTPSTDVINGTLAYANWAGFDKAASVSDYVAGHVVVLVCLGLQAVVHLRQRYRYIVEEEREPPRGVLFIKYAYIDTVDRDVFHCARYIANFVFYRFGTEICFITTTVVIAVRMDAIAVVYAFSLLCLLCLPRRFLSLVWFFYTIFLAIILPIQYASAVGLPQAACIKYPWPQGGFTIRFVQWLYLPDYEHMPNSKFLIADFFQLLFACCQLYVFRDERDPDHVQRAGDNRELRFDEASGDPLTWVLPVGDFMTYERSFLDSVKQMVFGYFHWLVLLMVFAAGVGAISLFAFGYLLGCFLLLWKGNEVFLKPMRLVLKFWRAILCYAATVILLKACLQIVGCVYSEELREKDWGCTIMQLFSIACQSLGSSLEQSSAKDVADSLLEQTKINTNDAGGGVSPEAKCTVSAEEGHIKYDACVIAFILVLQRILRSYYFQHVVRAFHAERMFAACGAALFNRLMLREIRSQVAKEESALDDVRTKMLAIKKAREDAAVTAGHEIAHPEHYARAKRPPELPQVDEDVPVRHDLLEPPHGEVAPEISEDPKGDQPGPLQILHGALQTDFDELKGQQREGFSPQHSVDKEEDLMVSPSDVALEETQDEEQPPAPGKLAAAWRFVSRISASTLRWATNLMNQFSRNYRYVAYLIDREKRRAKERKEHLTARATPSGTASPRSMRSARASPSVRSRDIIEEETQMDGCAVSRTLDSDEDRRRRWFQTQSESDLKKLADEVDEHQSQHGALRRFVDALFYLFVSRTEILCYLFMFVNHMQNASLLSLPFPLMAFFWGTLSAPRPPKRFWVAVITYAEAVVIVKFVFQFQFWDWNVAKPVSEFEPFIPQRLVGVERESMYAAWDIALLFVLFYHRYMMRRYGLWKNYDDIVDTIDGDAASVVSSSSMKSAVDTQTNTANPATDDTLTTVTPVLTDPTETPVTARTSTPIHSPLALPDVAVVQRGKRQPSSSATTSARVSRVTVKSMLDELELQDLARRKASLQERLTHLSDEAAGSVKSVDGTDGGIDGNQRFDGYCGACLRFFTALRNPSRWYLQDLYTLMFACDMICFVILVFGYASFGASQGTRGNVLSVIQGNKVPLPFVLTLLMQFTLIVIDRALYLRHAQTGRIAFHFLVVIAMHIWLFFVTPKVTDIRFTSNGAAQAYYFVKCLYFILSAWQIRSGYPTRTLGNFLTKQYNLLNFILFKVFMAIPFLFELRTLMDWIWTDTCMTLFDWFKMENIYSYAYSTKCSRKMEEEYPFPIGAKRGNIIKYGMGFTGLIVLFLIVWLPLLLFSMLNTIGIQNNPASCTIKIQLEGYPPFYEGNAQGTFIHELSDGEYESLGNWFARSKSAQQYIAAFSASNILYVDFTDYSQTLWMVTQKTKTSMQQLLDNSTSLQLTVAWTLTRPARDNDGSVILAGSKTINLPRGDPIRKQLQEAILIDKTTEKGEVLIPHLYFPFLDVPPTGNADILSSLSEAACEQLKQVDTQKCIDEFLVYSNVTLESMIEEKSGNMYWRANVSRDFTWQETGDPTVPATERQVEGPFFYAFVSKVFPELISSIVGKGIIGMYVAVVLVVGRVLRGVITGSLSEIMWDEVPDIDRVLRLCLDIFLVREAGDFALEVELFAKLLYLFRSPETMIMWTKPKLD